MSVPPAESKMSVYVDESRNPLGRMVMCHMIADTEEELHVMAGCLGLKYEWFQEPPKASHPHYDISLSRRTMAVKFGAIELDRRQFVRKMRQIAAK